MGTDAQYLQVISVPNFHQLLSLRRGEPPEQEGNILQIHLQMHQAMLITRSQGSSVPSGLAQSPLGFVLPAEPSISQNLGQIEVGVPAPHSRQQTTRGRAGSEPLPTTAVVKLGWTSTTLQARTDYHPANSHAPIQCCILTARSQTQTQNFLTKHQMTHLVKT